MQEEVFDPVLEAVVQEMEGKHLMPFITHHNRKTYILLSGVLGECPYVHRYMRDKFENKAHIFDTIDEYVKLF
jgi:hypothetical protein